MLAIMAMTSAAFVTCPGGPIFAFHPGRTNFIAYAEAMLPSYADTLRSELWRDGWITVTVLIPSRTDRNALHLAHRREQTIRRRMARLGVAKARIRFEVAEAKSDDDLRDGIDAYPSTLNTPQDVWDRLIEPRVMC